MQQPCQPHEPGVTTKSKTQHEGFKSNVVTHVREGCSAEIEAYGTVRTILWLFQPKEFCIRIDEALDKPGARQPVDPGMSACCPQAPLIGGMVKLSNRDAPDVLAVRRDTHQCCSFSFCIGQCSFCLYFRFTRKKINFGNSIKIPAQPFDKPSYGSMLYIFQRSPEFEYSTLKAGIFSSEIKQGGDFKTLFTFYF